MGIRLNKVLQELNVGTETVVEFLKSMPGFDTGTELNPNSKLTDEQYTVLCRRFHGDKVVKEKADSIFPALASKEQKPSINISDIQNEGIKVVGKIDLDSLNQSTRPQKKSQAQKEKERRAKRKEWLSKTRPQQISLSPNVETHTDENSRASSFLTKQIITLSQLKFEDGRILYTTNGNTVVCFHDGFPSYLTSYRRHALLKNYHTEIVIDYLDNTFSFSDRSVFDTLNKFKEVIDKEINKWRQEEFEKKTRQEKSNRDIGSNHDSGDKKKRPRMKVSKESEDKTKANAYKKVISILFASLKFGEGQATIIHDKKPYVYRDKRIQDYNDILGQIYMRLPASRVKRIRNFYIKVEISIDDGTFNLLDFDVCKYVNNLRGSFLPERKNGGQQNYRKSIQDLQMTLSRGKGAEQQRTTIGKQTSSVLKSTSLRADNIHFYNGYYLISLPAKKENSKSITPYRVNDRESNEVLNLVHKYFEQRFEQMRIVVRYNETKILEPSKLDQLQLSNYVRSLQRNIDVKGEWWEEVQNVRKRTLSQCHFELNTDVKKKAIKAKNDYLYNLSNLQNDKRLIRVYEINHGKEEDAFIFTITMPNDRCAVIFENASNDASTTTWVFVAKNEDYEACVNLVFDYFTDYMISSKRSSLRDANTNPPYKFKAESYTFADHNDLGQWLRKMDKILERTSHRDTIEFVPGLNIPQATNIRAGHNEAITTKSIHNELMQKLYDRLCQEHGEQNVGTEVRVGTRRIDAVVKGSDCFDIYEVKADPNPFNCVTEALGQICQYAYLYCRDKIGRMVIVGSSATTSEVENYLSWFREKHSLQVYYKPV